MVVNVTTLLKASPIKGMLGGKFKDHGVSYGLSEAGYDIRIKQEIRFVKAGRPDREFREVWQTEGDRTGIGRGRFALASAIEEFDMPPNLIGIVHDKSTWARRGLSVFNTVIEPGWKGFLTLELVYHGENELIIPAGAGIAQVIFHQTTDRANYTGKYQNQEDEPVHARESV